MIQHTPTPWYASDILDNDCYGIVSADDKIIIGTSGNVKRKEDIQFIVRAVNEYDNNQVVIGKLTKEIDHLEHSNKALLEAAKELLLCCDTRFSASNITGPVVDRMYKAIAQAEGKL